MMEDWREQANCKGVPTTVFFGGSGTLVFPPTRRRDTGDPEEFLLAGAKRYCNGCPVKKECLEWALTDPETVGIFGGMTARQRWALIGYSRKAVATHGTANMYDAHKCRCDLCREAKVAKNNAWKARRRQREAS